MPAKETESNLVWNYFKRHQNVLWILFFTWVSSYTIVIAFNFWAGFILLMTIVIPFALAGIFSLKKKP